MPAADEHRLVEGGAGFTSKIGSCALVAFLLLFVSIAALASLPSDRQGERPIVLIFPPWLDRAEAVQRSFEAGYSVMRVGRLPSIVVAAPTHLGILPRGAWLSLTLQGLAGCFDAAAEAGNAL